MSSTEDNQPDQSDQANDAVGDSATERSSEGRRPMIEAIGLSKFYGPFAAAREVSFSVSEG